MKNSAFHFFDDLVVVVHNRNPPSDEEIREMLPRLAQCDLDKLRMLVLSEGGGPNSYQRKLMTGTVGKHKFKTAVVSDAVFIRGVVTAFGWFNPNFKMFSPGKLDAALDYLDIPDHIRRSVHAKIIELIKILQPGEPL